MDIEERKKALWLTAKNLGNNLSAETQKQLVLGLIFLKYLTLPSNGQSNGSLLKDLPEASRLAFVQKSIEQADIGLLLDKAIDEVEKQDTNLTGIFYKNYSGIADKQSLSEFINLIESAVADNHKQKELLTQLFEYLLLKFEESERANGGKIYPPQSVVKLLVEIIDPRKGKIYDGCCGAGNTFIQSEKFIKKYRGKIDSVSLFGQESNDITLQIAKMNLVMHGLDADLQHGDTLTNDCFPGLAADYILSAPPLNATGRKSGRLADDKRWQYGIPSEENDDYAWLQHLVYKLSATGTAGIVLKKSSTNSSKGGDSKIRQNIIEDKLVDCIIVLPSKLFYTADSVAVIWILSRIKTNSRNAKAGNEILFIDAGKSQLTVRGKSRELTGEDIVQIARTYHRWKNINGDYIDIKGYCKAISIERVRKNGYSLTPERYVRAKAVKTVLPALLLIVVFALIYLQSLKTGLSTTARKKQDTAIAVQPQILKDSIQPGKKATQKVKRKVKDTAAANNNHFEANIHSAEITNNPPLVSNQPAPVTKPAETALPDAKNANGIIKYKVNSTAYFYNQPDESTRRKAFITHWNNSYADIEPLDEKNDFIYVVFTNHLHQKSKGWLRKKDLREVNQ